jgi:hypothetical protein
MKVRKYMASLDSDDPLGGPGQICRNRRNAALAAPAKGRGRSLLRRQARSFVGMLEQGRGADYPRIVHERPRASLVPVVQAACAARLAPINTDEFAELSKPFQARLSPQLRSPPQCWRVCRQRRADTVNRIEGFWNDAEARHQRDAHSRQPEASSEVSWRVRVSLEHASVPHLMLDRLMYSFVR